MILFNGQKFEVYKNGQLIACVSSYLLALNLLTH